MDDRSFPMNPVDRLSPALRQALERLCEAEGIALAQVQSISIDEEEISAHIVRPGGHGRVITYPLTVLLGHSRRDRKGALTRWP